MEQDGAGFMSSGHFKILIFDLELAYIGSANLTGAAFGMKGKDNRTSRPES